MNDDKSYRRIIRTTSAIAGASGINIVSGLIRTKVAAVVLGPAGVGLVGLFQNLIATASSISGLGLGTVGTRQIAESANGADPIAALTARRALSWGTSFLAVLGTALFWLSRRAIAVLIVGDAAYSEKVGWLAIGVALTVVAGSQTALLNGMRRIGDLAMLSVASGVVSTVLGIAVLYASGSDGIVAFVLVTPLAGVLLGAAFVSRLPGIPRQTVAFAEVAGQWKVMARLGVSVVVASVAFGVAQLIVRTLVVHELGAAALGQFQAAWTVSVIYAGFVFQAMGADYYPRLAASFGDDALFNRMVNEQAEVVLLLAGPVLIGVLALAPWVVELAYTAKFTDAVTVLRWQVLGDVIKVAGWPLGFVNLVAGDGRKYVFSETLSSLALVGFAWVGLPLFGIEATGMAVVGMNAVYFVAVMAFAVRRTGFVWQGRTRSHFLVLLAVAVVVFLIAMQSIMLAAILGALASLLLCVHAAARLAYMTGLGGTLGRVASFCRGLMLKLGIGSE